MFAPAGISRFPFEWVEWRDECSSFTVLLGLAAGPAAYLGDVVRRRLGLRCRQFKPDTIQRSSSGLASEVDRGLAEQVSRAAVCAAVAGESEEMIGLVRRANTWFTQPVALASNLDQDRLLLPAYYRELSGMLRPASCILCGRS